MLRSNFDKNLQEQLRNNECQSDDYNEHLMMMGYNIAGANTQNIFDQSSLYQEDQILRA